MIELVNYPPLEIEGSIVHLKASLPNSVVNTLVTLDPKINPTGKLIASIQTAIKEFEFDYMALTSKPNNVTISRREHGKFVSTKPKDEQ